VDPATPMRQQHVQSAGCKYVKVLRMLPILEGAAAHFARHFGKRHRRESTRADFPLAHFETRNLEPSADKLPKRGWCRGDRGPADGRYDTQNRRHHPSCGIGAHLALPAVRTPPDISLATMCRDNRGYGPTSQDPNLPDNARQTFHLTSADVSRLLCLKRRAVRGASLLVSAPVDLTTDGAHQRPDLLRCCLTPILPPTGAGEVPEGASVSMESAAELARNGHLTVFLPTPIYRTARRGSRDAMRLTHSGISRRLDLFDGASPTIQLHFEMQLQPATCPVLVLTIKQTARPQRIPSTGPIRKRVHLLRLWFVRYG